MVYMVCIILMIGSNLFITHSYDADNFIRRQKRQVGAVAAQNVQQNTSKPPPENVAHNDAGSTANKEKIAHIDAKGLQLPKLDSNENIDEKNVNDKDTDKKGSALKNESDVKKLEVTTGATYSVLPKVGDDMVQSGALMRAFIVFVALSVIIVLYFVFKSYRLRKGGSTSPAIIQKYGVRASRSDIEMRPLPLDEEEDDDTVFEIGNHTGR